MQAVILAAGMGKRLKKLTANNTKCMVKVNGTTLVERALRILDRKGLNRIVMVVGYQGQNLMDYIGTLGIRTPMVFIDNPVYATTNNIYSLLLARSYLEQEDTLLFESDLIFEEALVDLLMEDSRPTLALVDKFESWMDGTCTVLDAQDKIVDFIPGKYLKFSEKENYYKTVNIYKFSKNFSLNTYMPFLAAYAKAMGNNEYYESVIKVIAMLESGEIRAKRLTGQKWYEIDDVQDLDIAESMFAATAEERYDAINSRYGGYWRYPKMLDFCYLVNPYFPTPKMVDEMQSNFEVLLRQYPSGMRVNSLLAAKNFDLEQNEIVVGNGAAELIKSLMEQSGFGRVGFIRPTFEEYPHRFYGEAVEFNTAGQDFTYNAEDIMAFYGENPVDAVVLINPDNPSGNFIPLEGLLRLIDWAKEKGVAIIIDESFVDFANAGENGSWHDLTLLKSNILARYSRLYVVKSISKSYGAPGVRLGVLASSDTEKIARMKKDVAIWNINSYGEFFMQILEKYKNAYIEAARRTWAVRDAMEAGLRAIPGVKVYPSQANFIMCDITAAKLTSRQLAAALLEREIYIKDLTGKINNGRQYLRLAVRDEADNARLLAAMQELLG